MDPLRFTVMSVDGQRALPLIGVVIVGILGVMVSTNILLSASVYVHDHDISVTVNVLEIVFHELLLVRKTFSMTISVNISVHVYKEIIGLDIKFQEITVVLGSVAA